VAIPSLYIKISSMMNRELFWPQ